MAESSREGRNIAIIAYITLIGTVIALFMNSEKKDAYASFHIRQALGIFLTFFLLGYFIGYFDSWMVTTAFWIFIFVLWLYGFLSALQGNTKPLPLLGNFYQRTFKNI
ncbi:MAG: hypothetical protein EOO51_11425 [Flavobacterium sp.]|nr:MAG: hypothetical protein EOO51_11425 [Flavobacterium sp.]